MSLTIKGRPIHFSLKWLKPPPVPPDGTMTLFEHLRELRYRLIVSVLAIMVGMIVAWFFRYDLLDILQRPYFQAIEALKVEEPGYDHPPGQHQPDLAAHLVVEGLGVGRGHPHGTLLALPALGIRRPWPAGEGEEVGADLHRRRHPDVRGRRDCRLRRVAQGHHGAAELHPGRGEQPAGHQRLSVLSAAPDAGLRAWLPDPLIVLMLNIVGVIKAKQMAKYRSLVIFGTFVFGAVATPSTDPFSMLAVALPMALLFLAAEVIAHMLDRRKAQRAALAGDDLIIQRSVADDKALRELSEGNDDGLEPQR